MSVVIDDKEQSFKLHELRCLDAVVRFGSFQAAANALGRTHPSVFASVGCLEERLGFALFDRSGYRVEVTAAGRMFHTRAIISLRELTNLGVFARQLNQGEEPMLQVVLGDLCPCALILPALSLFFGDHPRTRLHLDYEAVGGPAERLREGTADLTFHRVEASDTDLDYIALREVDLVPVAAADFLPFAVQSGMTPERLRPFMQCVIRDTSKGGVSEEHFLIEGSDQCSVADHAMKKELILHKLAWGHLPDFMIEEELRTGALISLKSRDLTGRVETLAAVRMRDKPHGPVADALWTYLAAAFAGST